MSDWTDERKARLEADIRGEPFDGVYLLTRQRADIRAALGEIERRRAEAAAAWKSAIHNKERAEKAEAENDGLRHSLTDAADQLAQHQHDAQIKYDSLWDEASVMLMDEVHDHALTMDNLKGRCEQIVDHYAEACEWREAAHVEAKGVRCAFQERAKAAEAEVERLRGKLQRVRDWLVFAANSDGGIVAEIDAALRGGGE